MNDPTNPDENAFPPNETLNETIARAAETWTPEDIATIVAGLQEQRRQWNMNQKAGSKKRATSKKITPPKQKVIDLAQGLKGTIV